MDGKVKNFTREYESVKNNQELKNIQIEIKNSIHEFSTYLDQVKERIKINKLEHNTG